MEKIEIILDSIQLIRMSDEEYFSPKYKDYISNSGLGLLNPEQGGSLEAYINGFEEKFSESFELGSAIHCMVLQPGEFTISSFDKPSGKAGLFATNVFKLRQQGYKIIDALDEARKLSDYYAIGISKKILQSTIKKSLEYYLNRLHEETDGNVIYLSKALKEKYFSCMKNIVKDTEFLSLLSPSDSQIEVYNEYALFCDLKVTMDDEEVILKVKGKLDNFLIDHINREILLNDLKTTSKPVRFFMGNYIWNIDSDGNKQKIWIDGSFQKYHYYRQLGFYIWLLNAYVKHYLQLDYTLKTNMLLVETLPDYKTRIAPVSGKSIKRGLDEVKELLIILARWKMHVEKKFTIS